MTDQTTHQTRDPERMSDADKLRTLADYLDAKDNADGFVGDRSVQRDLRRMAAEKDGIYHERETLHSAADVAARWLGDDGHIMVRSLRKLADEGIAPLSSRVGEAQQ